MNIGIIGLGLIGGTIAKSLNKNHKITAYDINKDAINYAINNNIIHQGYYDIESFLKDNNLIYLCLYPTDIINFLKKYNDIINKNTLLIEISGIKTNLINEINKIKNKSYDIVFTHPIAGSEKIGVKYANENIFKDANYIITPIKSNKKTNIELAKKLAKGMKFKNISIISKEEHDQIIAYTSQLTHILSLSLVNSIDTNLNLINYIGDSYRDLTRIAEINTNLWPQLFVENKDNLIEKISKFQIELDNYKKVILAGDEKALTTLMEKSKIIHKKAMEENNNES
ncbi:MAG: prephenate dehydrogenase [Candidatus Izimaplasma sp.]|nr:prephenate dehydrogenase [Candidatus Izimaplasma bacterium]